MLSGRGTRGYIQCVFDGEPPDEFAENLQEEADENKYGKITFEELRNVSEPNVALVSVTPRTCMDIAKTILKFKKKTIRKANVIHTVK
ncbi:hypothetical protein DPMN_081885 [Dreissena polymorpha]|uniref:EF-hand domain-containing protein n=1 Tax=Dreissena polymorpha TaxID=45954 RepID=A0A9D3Y6P5_DREPO|nr:hypothetical protein DPMN_081885 [Dreissena polymorpha]